MVDKNYCMSSYLALRYIERDDCDFYNGIHHQNIILKPKNNRLMVNSAEEIDANLYLAFQEMKGIHLGILLSGGMDSAILASYMPEGSDAYTFRFLGGSFQTEELRRAEQFATRNNLSLHYVDIDWNQTVLPFLDIVMKSKAAPVHSIEPQLYQAAIQAKANSVKTLIIGESADLIFGGMDKLLSIDWSVQEFQERYTFVEPNLILNNPVDMSYLFKRYKMPQDRIDFLAFINDVFSIESASSYMNAFRAAGISYIDPYSMFSLRTPLDLNRIRHGESKYLIRELFCMKYPDISIPEKNPMPRPVDEYFKDWDGPKRPEFKTNINMSLLTGNQKWQIYCLERFLDIYEPIK